MIFQCDPAGNPRYSIPRAVEIWPLLAQEKDLVGDERSVYVALSIGVDSGGFPAPVDFAKITDAKLAKKLDWSVKRTRTASKLLVKRIQSHL